MKERPSRKKVNPSIFMKELKTSLSGPEFQNFKSVLKTMRAVQKQLAEGADGQKVAEVMSEVFTKTSLLFAGDRVKLGRVPPSPLLSPILILLWGCARDVCVCVG